MKKTTLVFYTFFLLLLSASCVDKKSESSAVKLISVEEINTVLELEGIQLVDVRTPAEYAELHIANAQNIDFYAPTFDADISKLDKTKPIIVYCKSGKRSGLSAKKLTDLGFKDIYELKGGILEWKRQNKLNP